MNGIDTPNLSGLLAANHRSDLTATGIPVPGTPIEIPIPGADVVVGAAQSAAGLINPFGAAASKVYSAVMTAGMELAISLALTVAGLALLVWALVHVANTSGVTDTARTAATTAAVAA